MHRSSFERMRAFREGYVAFAENQNLRVLDVGAASIEGAQTYRDLFAARNWNYTGLDTEPAPNVDIVVGDPFHWRELDDASFDVVISGQAFEHIEWPWLTMMEIARVLKPAGFAAITAPSSGNVHRYPKDCWRYYPDGFPALAKFAGLTLIENEVDRSLAFQESALWADAFVILQKPVLSAQDALEWHRRRVSARRSAGLIEADGAADAALSVAPFKPDASTLNVLRRQVDQDGGGD